MHDFEVAWPIYLYVWEPTGDGDGQLETSNSTVRFYRSRSCCIWNVRISGNSGYQLYVDEPRAGKDTVLNVTFVDFVLSVVFSPIVETSALSFVFLISCKLLRLPPATFIFFGGVLGYVGHHYRGLFAILASVAFAIFSAQYIYVRRKLNAQMAFAEVTLSHMANNLAVFLVGAVAAQWSVR